MSRREAMMGNDLSPVMPAPAATPREIPLVEVRRDRKTYPRLKDYKQDDLLMPMRNLVNYAALLRGQRLEEDVLDFTASQLLLFLMERNPQGTRNLTWYEVSRAIRRGVMKEDMHGISVQSLFSIIIKYIMTEGMDADKKAGEAPPPAPDSARDTMLASWAGRIARTKTIK